MDRADLHPIEPEQTGPRPPLVVLVGPTAVGKTGISIQLAERLGGEIISADSRLFYRGMNIGTAKPTIEERRGVPHHLIDVADPDQPWSLALFQSEARKAVSEAYQHGKLPFLVGGTGQYVRAVLQGWEVPRVEPDPSLRSVLERWAEEVTPEGLHRRLAVLDPPAASQIDYRNLRRTIRALEVIFSTGMRFSEQRGSGPSPYRALLLGLNRPREELYRRIDERIQGMLSAGLIEEVQGLLQQGYPPDLSTFSAIGYRETIAYLHGNISLDEVITLIKRNTRTYVRRQASWFKADDPEIHWFQAAPDTVDFMEAEIKRWLKNSEADSRF